MASPFTVAALAACLTTPVSPGDDVWTQDYPAAQARAAAEGKDLLLDFTGSDWCTWCVRLHREVFATEQFQVAWRDFVPVTVDFPSDESILPPGVKEQNEALRARLPIGGFPTIYLLDAEGRPYATTGYREGGPQPYLEHLSNLRLVRELRDAAWEAAARFPAEAAGLAKAERLDQGLEVLPRELLFPHYLAVITEAQALDPEDSLGLALKYELLADPQGMASAKQALEQMVADMAREGDWPGLVMAMDLTAERYRALRELNQFALMYKAVGQLELQDLRAGLETLLAARERDPKGGLVGRLDRMLVAVRAELGDRDF
jgi:Thioredoxin-like